MVTLSWLLWSDWSARLELVSNAFPTTMYCRYCRIISLVVLNIILERWQIPMLYIAFLYVCIYIYIFTCVCSLGWVQEAGFRGRNSVVLAFCGMIGNGWKMFALYLHTFASSRLKGRSRARHRSCGPFEPPKIRAARTSTLPPGAQKGWQGRGGRA